MKIAVVGAGVSGLAFAAAMKQRRPMRTSPSSNATSPRAAGPGLRHVLNRTGLAALAELGLRAISGYRPAPKAMTRLMPPTRTAGAAVAALRSPEASHAPANVELQDVVSDRALGKDAVLGCHNLLARPCGPAEG